MALSRVVSEIFNIEKYRDHEIPVKSQSMSLKVVPFDRLGVVSCQCSIVTLSLRQVKHSLYLRQVEILNLKNAVTLKTGLRFHQGHRKCHHLIERI